jgi:hypothetical protein
VHKKNLAECEKSGKIGNVSKNINFIRLQSVDWETTILALVV